MRFTSAILASLAASTSTVLATPAVVDSLFRRGSSLPPVEVKGNAFFAGSERFFIRGVDYQPGGPSSPVDPIANIEGCKRDVPYFKQLGINTIRVYTVDNTKDHDECMNLLAENGIYLALDVNSGKYSINRNQPAISYNAPYLQSVFATIDAFQKYSNTLLFFSGNEVVNDPTNTNCAPYIKAVTRDMKQYIASRGYRKIPCGYSAADVSQNRYQMAAYMNCGGSSARSDFFSFNDYSYCDSSFQVSGWADEVKLYSNYSIPIFLSEFGCNKHLPRTFPEIADLYGSEMTAVYSGGLVYEYSEESEPPNFGLVKISGNSVSPVADFAHLKKMYANNPSPTGSSSHQNLQPLACPGKSAMWEVNTDKIPDTPSGAMTYMKAGAGTGPGLGGSGSQESGTGQHTWSVPGNSYSSSSGSDSSSGTASGDDSATSTNAASSNLRPTEFALGPLVCGLVVIVSTISGAALL